MLLGLTGGIACGKSTVTKLLENLGCLVIDADQINRELSALGGPIWRGVKERFGEGVFASDGRIDGKKLGKIIFEDPEKRKALEAIAHPLIIHEENRRIESIQKEFPRRVIVLEASLLIEAGQHHRVDKLIVVTADREKRLARLAANKGMDPDEAQLRMNAQLSCEEKAKFADYVIKNNGTKEELALQVEKLARELKIIS